MKKILSIFFLLLLTNCNTVTGTIEGTALGVSTDGIMEFSLTNGQTLYASPLSKDLIGISTARVGLGSTGSLVGINSTTNVSTLYFTGIGTGLYHSFKTNYDVITGEIRRTTATVSTGETHGLLNYENVYMNVVSGITTTVRQVSGNEKMSDRSSRARCTWWHTVDEAVWRSWPCRLPWTRV